MTVLSVALGASFVWAQSAPFEPTGPSRPQTEPFGRARAQTTSRAQTTHYENAWTRQTPSRAATRPFGARRFGRSFAPVYGGTSQPVPTQTTSGTSQPVPPTSVANGTSRTVPPTSVANGTSRTVPPTSVANGTSQTAPPTSVLNAASQTVANEQAPTNAVPPTQAGPTPVSPRRVSPTAAAPTVGTTPTPGTPTVREAVPIPGTPPLETAPSPSTRSALKPLRSKTSRTSAAAAPSSASQPPRQTPLRPESSSDRARPGALENERGASPEEVQEAALDQMLNGVDPVAKPAGVDASYWNALVPDGNESTPERFALGKKLFFDRRLSSDGTVSCATCHDASRGFADDRPTSEGVGGQLGVRNSPTAACSAFFYRLFWDGRSPNLEHQALQPIVNRREMGRPLDSEGVVAEIFDDPEYKAMFQAAYGRDVNYADVGNALAVFERGLNFVDNPFFRYLRGDENAISQDAKEGWKIFNDRGRCVSCHQISPSNPVGTNHKFHNIGVDDPAPNFQALAKRAATALNESPLPERTTEELAFDPELNKLGRFNVTALANDVGGFRTQQILNVGVTAPYMRDGSLATLWDVVDHYNKGGTPSLAHDGGIEPLNLSERQVEQLVAFLFSLTDVRFGAENAREFERQRAVAAQRRPERDDEAASRRTLLFERFTRPEKTGVADAAVELTPTADAPGKNVGSISETTTVSASERELEGAEKETDAENDKTSPENEPPFEIEIGDDEDALFLLVPDEDEPTQTPETKGENER
ncbi:MAG: hypothetical protein IJO06_14035 [Thermoguttaceae bacterium]|nr:hypothetical protein [Thermoguttaceae bacterium]